MANQFGDTFEIYVSKYTKGYGVDHLLEKLGIDRENAYAFGDGENDMDMPDTQESGSRWAMQRKTSRFVRIT